MENSALINAKNVFFYTRDKKSVREQNISSWVPELPAFEHGIMEDIERRVFIGHHLWTSKVPDSGHERYRLLG
ncbi:unnamed protein product [Rhizophagus irregularis]|uniref:Uncharacterized protein n=1 Tax=Rhizophagus irregularis TaxID=588596 RepID=A0A916E661_9GLOM|nr:unnamed protein product [Rhizophagus irregularis]